MRNCMVSTNYFSATLRLRVMRLRLRVMRLTSNIIFGGVMTVLAY